MEEIEKKSYYAIIPANVRYDKNLKLLSKLLYGEITALCNEKGYCWATNKYFANLYDVSIQTISNCIAQLKENNYIYVEMEYKKGTKEILNRYIKIFEYPIKENFNTPIKEIFKDNNTIMNNTINNINKQEISNEFNRFYANYPRKVGKAEAKKKFTNIIKKSKDSSIIANIFYGLECYKKSIIANKTETKYIKHPTTWLNQECWKDYEKQVQFTKIDEDRLITLQEIVLKSPILTDKERLEAEKEVAKLLEKKKQCR